MTTDRDEVVGHLVGIARDGLSEGVADALPHVVDDALACGADFDLSDSGAGLRWPIGGAPAPVIRLYVDKYACVEMNLHRAMHPTLAAAIERRLLRALPQTGGTLGLRPNFSLHALSLPDSRAALAEVFEHIAGETFATGDRVAIADLPVVPWTVPEMRDLRERANAALLTLADHLAEHPGRRYSLQQLSRPVGLPTKNLPAQLAGLSTITKTHFGRRNWPFEVAQADASKWIYWMEPVVSPLRLEARESQGPA
jgi:hypothetical protein